MVFSGKISRTYAGALDRGSLLAVDTFSVQDQERGITRET